MVTGLAKERSDTPRLCENLSRASFGSMIQELDPEKRGTTLINRGFKSLGWKACSKILIKLGMVRSPLLMSSRLHAARFESKHL